MNKKLIAAVHASIEHWYENLIAVTMAECCINDNGFLVDAPLFRDFGYSNNAGDCAICRAVVTECEQCPIGDCDITPWAYTPNPTETPMYNGSVINRVGAEIDFLVSLLPKKERKRYEYRPIPAIVRRQKNIAAARRIQS